MYLQQCHKEPVIKCLNRHSVQHMCSTSERKETAQFLICFLLQRLAVHYMFIILHVYEWAFAHGEAQWLH